MIKEHRTIDLLCLFCGDGLVAEEKEYQSGDLIECTKCGKSNDYDSVIEVAKEEGLSQVSSELQAELKKSLGKAFKFK